MAKMTLKDLSNVLIKKAVEKRVTAFENDFGLIDSSKVKTFLKQLNSLDLLEDVEDYKKQAKEIVNTIENARAF